nr:hypothetical protein A5888_000567 [Enterococcus sp. 9E7_DIV0242]
MPVELGLQLISQLHIIQQVNAEYLQQELSIEDIIAEAISEPYKEAVSEVQFQETHRLPSEAVTAILSIMQQLAWVIEYEPFEGYLRNVATLSSTNIRVSMLELSKSHVLVQISNDGIIVQCYRIPISKVRKAFILYQQVTDRWCEANLFELLDQLEMNSYTQS